MTASLVFSFLELNVGNKIRRYWIDDSSVSCFKRHVFSRVAFLFLATVTVATNFSEGIVGLYVGGVTILTLGKWDISYTIAFTELKGFNQLVAVPFFYVIRAIDPATKDFEGEKLNEGLITKYIKSFFENRVHRCLRKDKAIYKHVFSRLAYALMALACVITRIVDGIIGVVAALLALIFNSVNLVHRVDEKRLNKINCIAFQGLQAPGVIHDLVYCTVKCINPWAGGKQGLQPI